MADCRKNPDGSCGCPKDQKPLYSFGDYVYCKVDNKWLKLEGWGTVMQSKDADGFYQVRFEESGICVPANDSMLSKNHPKKTISCIDLPLPYKCSYTQGLSNFQEAKTLSIELEFMSESDAREFRVKFLSALVEVKTK